MSATGDKFALDISAFVAKAKGRGDMVLRKVVLDMGRRLVELSPVGDRELWAINTVTMMNREAFQLFREERGKKRATRRTLQKNFPLKGPKGYVGGRFRANWQYGVDSPPDGELFAPHQAGYPSAGEVLGAMSAQMGGVSGPMLGAGAGKPSYIGRRHYIVNNLPYAQRLEDGWSTQAPAGMVAITVSEFQAHIDEAVRSLPR